MGRKMFLDAILSNAERNRRRLIRERGKRDPGHYLVEALWLFDRLDDVPHQTASRLLHKISLEAAKRKRRHEREATR
jgi:hypothetical protein